MKGDQPFPAGTWIDQRGTSLSTDDLGDYVTLVTRIDCQQSDELMKTLGQLYDQFKETKKATYIILDDCVEDSISLSDSNKISWFVFSCGDSAGLCEQLLENWPPGKSHALVDKNQRIRSYYPSATMDEKRILLEHMALLLPRERSEKVELKRGDKK